MYHDVSQDTETSSKLRDAVTSDRENVCNKSKNVNSQVFLDFEKKTLTNVGYTYSFTGHLITQPLITQLPKVSTGKSRSSTSNILLRSLLRSSSHSLLHVPRIKTDFGRRAFSSDAPQIWNHIPTAIRFSASLDSFKRLLKTHYFASP